MPSSNSRRSLHRLERVEQTIEAQKDFIRHVPDPDNRYLAEANLVTLALMRDDLLQAISRGEPSEDRNRLRTHH